MLEQNMNEEQKIVCVENKTIRMSVLSEFKANNKSNDENRTLDGWNDEENRNTIDGRPEQRTKRMIFHKTSAHSSNHENERNKGILLSARLN